MSDNIIQLNEAAIKGELKNLVKNSVEETLNALLDHEADNWSMQSATSAQATGKDIVPVITTETSPRLQVMLSFMSRN